MEKSSAEKAQDVIAEVARRLNLDGHREGEGMQVPASSGEAVESFFVPADPGDPGAEGYELSFPDDPNRPATMRVLYPIPRATSIGRKMLAETARIHPDDGSSVQPVEGEVVDEDKEKYWPTE